MNQIMHELAQYNLMMEELQATIDALKDQIKEHMKMNGLEVLAGDEHKCTLKTISSTRLDTTALKKAHPDLAQEFTRTTETTRFTFT